MICIYKESEIAFNNIGEAVLDDVLSGKPKIIEELNGAYTLELNISIVNNIKHDKVQKDMIIKADDNYFRIKARRKNFNSIYVFAKQIFWDCEDNLLEDVRPTNVNGAAALNWMGTHTQYTHPFVFNSDIQTNNTAYYIRKNLLESIMSVENSFLATWGGELELSKFNVKINQQRGLDRGVNISYGKNLIGIEEYLNTSNVVTRIMPVGQDENNQPVLLPEKYIDSQYISNYPNPKIAVKEFNDIKVDIENGITLEMVHTLLRSKVQELYDSGIDLPYYNYTVDFKELSKTEEYKNYAVLERVYLGDTVTIKHKKIGIDLKARLIKTVKEYNVAKQQWQYKEIELGQFKPNYITKSKAEQTEIKKSIDTTKTNLMTAVTNATNLITGNKGGYLILRYDANGKPYEFLIMDTENISTAENVWRFNQEGLGHSSTGYNGQFTTAITSDGRIVADFITAGTMLANLIKGGVLTLGGEDNGNGLAVILNSTGAEMVRIDNTGVMSKAFFNNDTLVKYSTLKDGELYLKRNNNGTETGYAEITVGADDKLGFFAKKGVAINNIGSGNYSILDIIFTATGPDAHQGNIEIYGSLGLKNGVDLNLGPGNSLHIDNGNGSLNIGAQSADWCHFYTDRSKSYFNAPVHIDNEIRVYGTYTTLTPNQLSGINYITQPNNNGCYQFQDANNYVLYFNNLQKHVFGSTGAKIGGTIEVEGMNYGMSPIDSPRALIEDIIFDLEVDESGTVVELDDILAKAIVGYAVFPSNGKAEICNKNKTSFIVKGYTGIIDLRIVGNRRDRVDQYFELMQGCPSTEQNEVAEPTQNAAEVTTPQTQPIDIRRVDL